MNNFQKFVLANCEFRLVAHEEDIQPSSGFSEQEDVNWVMEQLAAGNEAAWFVAEVQAIGFGYTAHEFLGGCSYTSFENFKQSDYFQQMKECAIEKLCETIMAIN